MATVRGLFYAFQSVQYYLHILWNVCVLLVDQSPVSFQEDHKMYSDPQQQLMGSGLISQSQASMESRLEPYVSVSFVGKHQIRLSPTRVFLIFSYNSKQHSDSHHRGCLNNPIFSNLGLCAACWARFMCHHELWSTSVSHPCSSLSSSLGFARGKH